MLNENWVTKKFNDDILQDYQDKIIPSEKDIFPIQMDVHLAHVIMLAEQKIITKAEAGKLLEALLKLRELGPDVIKIAPGLTDLYSNLERWLIDEIGVDVGGKMHTGRSHNDMFNIFGRMEVRAYLIDFGLNLCKLQEQLLNTCAEHLNTVMPGYTHHDQHAQPTTMAHQMLASFDIFQRDHERAFSCFDMVNRCSMGSAALCGTGWPINRERVADLLGFDSVIENTIDATGSRDFAMEAGYVYSQYLSNLNRLSELLLVWNVREIGMVRLSRKHCSYSSIMPQKNNPICIENLRGAGELSYGLLSGMFATMKGTTTGNGREPAYVMKMLGIITEQTIPTPVYMADVIREMKVEKERCLQLAREGFSTMTELADTIVRKTGVSFYFAHKVVGRVAAAAIDNDYPCEKITAKMMDDIAMEQFNKKLGLTDEDIQNCLDPVKNVMVRSTVGGPAPAMVAAMREKRLAELDANTAAWQARKSGIQTCSANIVSEAKKRSAD